MSSSNRRTEGGSKNLGGSSSNDNPNKTRTRKSTRSKKLTNLATNEKQRISLRGSTAIVSDYFKFAINCILFQRAIYDQSDFKIVKKFGLQMMVVEDEAISNHIQKIIDQVRIWLVKGKLSGLVLVIQNRDSSETIERWEFEVKIEEDERGGGKRLKEEEDQLRPKKKNKDETNTENSSKEDDEDEERLEGESSKDKKKKKKKKRITTNNNSNDNDDDDDEEEEEEEFNNSNRNGLKKKSLNEIQNEIQDIIRQIIATVSFLPIPDSNRTFKVLAYTDRLGEEDEDDDENFNEDWKDSEALDITHGAERVKLKSFTTGIHKVDTAVDYKLGEPII